jgi:hypothetical protein
VSVVSDGEKIRITAKSMAPDMRVADVSKRTPATRDRRRQIKCLLLQTLSRVSSSFSGAAERRSALSSQPASSARASTEPRGG